MAEGAGFVSILPPPLAADARFAALERLEADRLARHDLAGLLPNLVDSAPGWMLPYLAEQFGVLGWEVWRMCPHDDARRELIRNAIALRKYHGTRWSVVEVFRILGMSAVLQEWFEYGGEPGCFRVDLAVSDRGISQELYERAMCAVMQHKNLRSHLERLRVIVSTGCTLYWGAAAVVGESVWVGPWSPRDLRGDGVLYVGAASVVSEVINVYSQ